MPGVKLLVLILLMLIASGPSAHGEPVTVYSIADLNAAIAGAGSGDTIILANGTYASAGTIDFNANGAPGSEITVKAQTPGHVIITGKPSHVRMRGSYLILSGFHFRDIDTSGNWNTLLIRMDNLTHSRITNCKIENVGQGGGSTIVGIWENAHHNRIDHCTWDGVDGVGIETVLRYYGGTVNSTHTRIDHNMFLNHAQDYASEALRLGRGATSALVNAYMTVEYNYFESWHGDPEVISVKSSNNLLRYNVIKNCNGAYKLRTGNQNTLEGNFYILEDTESWDDYLSAVGIKIKGKDHNVFNNYIYRGWHGISLEHAPLLTYEGSATSQPSAAEPYYLTDTNATYADDQYNGQYVWITAGGGAGNAYYVHDTDGASQRLHLYTQSGGTDADLHADGVTDGSDYFINTGEPEVRNLFLANNTIVNNRRNGIMAKSTSSNCTFMNNLILTNTNSSLYYLFQEDSGADVTYTTNLGHSTGTMKVWGGDNGQPAGIMTGDPQMDCSGEICRLTADSTNAIGQGTPDAVVWDDIEGHTRDAGFPDIGCDEYAAAAPIRSVAMIEEGAGVQWVAPPLPPIGVASGDLEAGYYETTGKGKNKTTVFVGTTSFSVGDEVVILATVTDANAQAVTGAVVDISISGPEDKTLVSDPSDSEGIAQATWNTTAAKGKKKQNPGTATGDYRATVTGVTAAGYTWDEVQTYIDFTIE